MKVIGIDDDEGTVDVIKIIFEHHPDIVPNFELFTDADKLLKSLTPDVHICIIDYYLKGINGLELIKKIVQKNPYCWFIMLSGQQSLSVIIDFMNHTYGTRYIEKAKDDLKEKLLYFIKDIRERIEVIETFYYSREGFKGAVSEFKQSVSDLKDSI